TLVHSFVHRYELEASGHQLAGPTRRQVPDGNPLGRAKSAFTRPAVCDRDAEWRVFAAVTAVDECAEFHRWGASRPPSHRAATSSISVRCAFAGGCLSEARPISCIPGHGGLSRWTC